MSDDAPSCYVVVDLDNLLGGSWPTARDEASLVPEFNEILQTAEELTGWHISTGHASMNRHSRQRLPDQAFVVMNEWGLSANVVESLPEEADKELFFFLGQAVGQGYQHFLIISEDKGFSKAAHYIRSHAPKSKICVVANYLTENFHTDYGPFDVQLVGLNSGRSQKPTINKAKPRRSPDYILVCHFCGKRYIQSHIGEDPICYHCGSSLNTFSLTGNIIPEGMLPFKDGPILEVWFRGQHLKTVVLANQSTTFGRNPKRELLEPGFVDLGRLVDNPTRISREQFSVNQRSSTERVLFRRGGKKMYDIDGDVIEEMLVLSDTQGFFVNNPNKPRHAESLLYFVYREKM